MQTLERPASPLPGPRNDETSALFTDRRLTMKSIRDTFSPQALERPLWKGLAYFARDLVLFIACIALLWQVDQWYYVIPLWLVAGLLISSLFVIGHDAC